MDGWMDAWMDGWMHAWVGVGGLVVGGRRFTPVFLSTGAVVYHQYYCSTTQQTISAAVMYQGCLYRQWVRAPRGYTAAKATSFLGATYVNLVHLFWAEYCSVYTVQPKRVPKHRGWSHDLPQYREARNYDRDIKTETRKVAPSSQAHEPLLSGQTASNQRGLTIAAVKRAGSAP